jgi:HPt (histidine-containing phosphotransfer) domain-containing protein
MPDKDKPAVNAGGPGGERTGDSSGGKPKLRSLFEDDPEMTEILGVFVQEMPGRIADFRACWEGKELDRLTRLAHQLKGAGGGYGYPALGEAADRLEKTLKQLVEQGSPVALPRLQAEFNALLELCRSVSVK